MTTSPITWKDILSEEKTKPYFQNIVNFLNEARQKFNIYPAQEDVFNAIKMTPYDKVKVVILGQDPYHGPNQAHGLSFSVKSGIAFPPSLQNIFLELQKDLKIPLSKTGCLEGWAKQGVLLLNTVLTVQAGQPQSHAQIGWQTFTDQVIKCLNEHEKPIVFLLWGSHAQNKIPLITSSKHYILKAPHPSPLSAHRGFFGCKHFSKTNEILRAEGLEEIDWRLEKLQS